jgi:hypothetical protein
MVTTEPHYPRRKGPPVSDEEEAGRTATVGLGADAVNGNRTTVPRTAAHGLVTYTEYCYLDQTTQRQMAEDRDQNLRLSHYVSTLYY